MLPLRSEEDSAVVFNEVQYHPAASGTEWIEFRNLMGVNVNISGWRLRGGVDFDFPEGTVISGRGYIVVAAMPENPALAGLGALGPWQGMLNNAGEEIRLLNRDGRVMDQLEYGDSGEWPVAADGSGVTLSKRKQDSGDSDVTNWTISAEIGGSPGKVNFAIPGTQPVSIEVANIGAEWKYFPGGTPPAGWNTTAYDDTSWQSGEGLLYAGAAQTVGGGAGLLGYWPLNETSGTVAPNAVTGGQDAALVNGPSWVNDPSRGRVLQFDGSNDYATAGSTAIPVMTLTNDFTWSFWASSAEGPGSNVILGNRYSPSGSDFNPREFIKFTSARFEFHRDGAGEDIDYPDFGANSGWMHHAVVKKGSTLTYFRNGTPSGSQTITASLNNSQPLYFGGDRDSECWSGMLDDIAIWSRALTSGEIDQLANASVSPSSVGGAGALTTQLPSAQKTYYFRRTFDFNGDPRRTLLRLRHVVDDGAVIYLNGQEVYRTNLPPGAVSHDTPASTTIQNAALSPTIEIPATALLRGSNVLAVSVHQAQASNDPDMVFGLSLTAIEQAPPVPGVVPTGLVFNEISAASDPAFAIELANTSDAAVSIGGYQIVSSTGLIYTLPSQTLNPGAYLAISKEQLGFAPLNNAVLFLRKPNGAGIADAQKVTNSLRGRSLQHPGRWLYPHSATFGAANAFSFNTAVVINEIMYHAKPAVPGGVNDEQWVELYNQSKEAVDLSGWAFDAGITYTFPAGVTLAPGGYLVISNNAQALSSRHPSAFVLGNFSGSLARSGERLQLVDARKNPVAEVRYHDGGRWPSAADGGGSSLELRSPNTDRSAPESWTASDESSRGTWQTFTWQGSATSFNNDPEQWQEFIFGLLDAGTVLIDDISVKDVTAGNTELIQNGSFESGVNGWRFLGTHRHAAVVPDPSGGGQVLQLTTSGPTEHMHNHVETTLMSGSNYVTIDSAHTYRISFRARWLSGCNQLNARLYFNRLARTWVLPVANGGGTPGAVNSVAVANLGPTYSELTHSPAVPPAGESATVSVKPADPHGINTLTLHYSVNDSTFTSVAMSPQTDGSYTGVIPAQSSGAKVQFYVRAMDSLGSVAFFPAGGANSRAIIPWNDGNARLEMNGVAPTNIRIVMTGADADFLHTPTNVMSNDRLPCTVIYDESEIFYDCGVRLKGSQRGRNQPTRVSFNLGFPDDRKFLGVHGGIAIDRSGAGNQTSQKEILVKHAISHAGGIPGSEDDLCRVIAPRMEHTGSAILVKSRFDNDYLDNAYEDGSDGRLFKYELIYYPTTTTGNGGNPGNTGSASENLKYPEPDNVVGVGLNRLGADKELHRWHWLTLNNEDSDDYSGLMTWLGAFSRTSDAQYHSDTRAMIDVDEWLRCFAIEVLFGIGDNYATGSQHNFIVYQRPADLRWLFFPHDMDFTFSQGTSSSLTPNGDLDKLLTNPANKRAYYGHLLDLCTTTFNSTYLTPWAQHYSLFLEENLTSYISYIEARRSYALSRIESAVPSTNFAITTPDGAASPGPMATVQGTAWLDVRELRLQGAPQAMNLTWIDDHTWQGQVPIVSGNNTITVNAYDFQGSIIGTDSVQIVGTGNVLPASAANLVISEIMYHPGPLSTAEQQAGFTDPEAFEFIEIQNISQTHSVSLNGLTFAKGISFTFPNAILTPRSRAIVAANIAAFQQRYGRSIDDLLLGEYGAVSALANGGEQLVLLDAGGQTIRDFAYDDAAPWPASSDGLGFSLILINPGSNPNHSNPANWRSSAANNGNPGTTDASTFTGDPDGDDDGDGISNLVRYALTGENPVELPTVSYDGGYLSIQYSRNLAADDISYEVERSTNLQTWRGGATETTLVSETYENDGMTTVTWRSVYPLNEERSEFLRLRITKRP